MKEEKEPIQETGEQPKKYLREGNVIFEMPVCPIIHNPIPSDMNHFLILPKDGDPGVITDPDEIKFRPLNPDDMEDLKDVFFAYKRQLTARLNMIEAVQKEGYANVQKKYYVEWSNPVDVDQIYDSFPEIRSLQAMKEVEENPEKLEVFSKILFYQDGFANPNENGPFQLDQFGDPVMENGELVHDPDELLPKFPVASVAYLQTVLMRMEEILKNRERIGKARYQSTGRKIKDNEIVPTINSKESREMRRVSILDRAYAETIDGKRIIRIPIPLAMHEKREIIATYSFEYHGKGREDLEAKDILNSKNHQILEKIALLWKKVEENEDVEAWFTLVQIYREITGNDKMGPSVLKDLFDRIICLSNVWGSRIAMVEEKPGSGTYKPLRDSELYQQYKYLVKPEAEHLFRMLSFNRMKKDVDVHGGLSKYTFKFEEIPQLYRLLEEDKQILNMPMGATRALKYNESEYPSMALEFLRGISGARRKRNNDRIQLHFKLDKYFTFIGNPKTNKKRRIEDLENCLARFVRFGVKGYFDYFIDVPNGVFLVWSNEAHKRKTLKELDSESLVFVQKRIEKDKERIRTAKKEITAKKREIKSLEVQERRIRNQRAKALSMKEKQDCNTALDRNKKAKNEAELLIKKNQEFLDSATDSVTGKIKKLPLNKVRYTKDTE